ncbi:hypothetical protein I6E09_09270 [Mediterraneibacter glycyrrhizinilyticus]|uniref:hypothetical protein n=1 Tax=Mediterraneibacter glycyrrhizinilyticus TaxID=342942 RepID=UPI00265AE4C2|nr:hypothetical protein [Mediterraneibacter glycyrrhizinilyticus]MCF2569351.1 hypothetical protein [Mediterraneibacter glycyrrhizinilyticus]
MSKEETISHMISFVEDAERELQAANLAGESKAARADIVNAILNELEREVEDED